MTTADPASTAQEDTVRPACSLEDVWSYGYERDINYPETLKPIPE